MEYITYRQAADLLCMKEGTVRAAAAKGILTKVPTTSIRQLLIKEQVSLFKGKKQIRETMLSNEEKIAWNEYREIIESKKNESALLDDNAVNALTERRTDEQSRAQNVVKNVKLQYITKAGNWQDTSKSTDVLQTDVNAISREKTAKALLDHITEGKAHILAVYDMPQQDMHLLHNEQENSAIGDKKEKQKKNTTKVYTILNKEELEVNHIAETFIALFAKSVNRLTMMLPELRRKKAENSLTKLEAFSAFKEYGFVVDIGKAIHMNCSEMFAEVKEITLSSYPELENQVSLEISDGIIKYSDNENILSPSPSVHSERSSW